MFTYSVCVCVCVCGVCEGHWHKPLRLYHIDFPGVKSMNYDSFKDL